MFYALVVHYPLGLGTPGLTLIPDGLGVWYNHTLQDYAFDIPDPNFLLNVMSSEAIADAGNDSGYSNPSYDDLYNQQGAELDQEQRKALVWQMQEMVHDDVVYINPFYTQRAQAYRSDRFTGWRWRI